MSRRHLRPERTPASTVPLESPELGAVPLSDPDAALFHVRLAMPKPFAAETIAMFTTEDYRPGICLIVEGSAHADHIASVAELLVDIADDHRLSNLILVSCRPGQPFEPEDTNRWFRLDHLFVGTSVELVEWFVCDEDSVVAVSTVSGEHSRWPEPG